jgi:hypothetical protein
VSPQWTRKHFNSFEAKHRLRGLAIVAVYLFEPQL